MEFGLCCVVDFLIHFIYATNFKRISQASYTMIPKAFFFILFPPWLCTVMYIKNENLVLFFNNNDNENFFLWEMEKVQKQRNDKINF